MQGQVGQEGHEAGCHHWDKKCRVGLGPRPSHLLHTHAPPSVTYRNTLTTICHVYYDTLNAHLPTPPSVTYANTLYTICHVHYAPFKVHTCDSSMRRRFEPSPLLSRVPASSLAYPRASTRVATSPPAPPPWPWPRALPVETRVCVCVNLCACMRACACVCGYDHRHRQHHHRGLGHAHCRRGCVCVCVLGKV